MKTLVQSLMVCLVIAAFAAPPLSAQRPPRPEGPPSPPGFPPADRPRPPEDGRRGGRPDGFRPPPNPLLEALDRDGNRELSADEIAGAAAALKSLDLDDDGVLSREELRPRPGRADGGFERGRRASPPDGERDFGRRGPPDEEGRRGRRGPPDEDGPRRRPTPPDGPGPPEGGRFDAAKYVERLMRFDDNEDGKVSRDELPDRLRKMIEKGDQDDDDALSEAELQAIAADAGSPGRRGKDQKRGGRSD